MPPVGVGNGKGARDKDRSIRKEKKNPLQLPSQKSISEKQ